MNEETKAQEERICKGINKLATECKQLIKENKALKEELAEAKRDPDLFKKKTIIEQVREQ